VDATGHTRRASLGVCLRPVRFISIWKSPDPADAITGKRFTAAIRKPRVIFVSLVSFDQIHPRKGMYATKG